ncbi:MAG: transcriptional regulator [Deltaproteobacteria bacterium]|jgi:HTH-type transcriptional regulator/antitoxin HigA|nr:transcriptional regulator [Deltaproteobacteria bacterium]
MIKPIRDKKSYNQALKRIESLWGSEIGTPEGDELDVLMILVEAYEDNHYPMPPSDPVEAILFRMEQMDLRRKDLEAFMGPKSRVSDVLNRKRRLSMNQIVKLHYGMGIPYESLIDESLGA